MKKILIKINTRYIELVQIHTGINCIFFVSFNRANVIGRLCFLTCMNEDMVLRIVKFLQLILIDSTCMLVNKHRCSTHFRVSINISFIRPACPSNFVKKPILGLFYGVIRKNWKSSRASQIPHRLFPPSRCGKKL